MSMKPFSEMCEEDIYPTMNCPNCGDEQVDYDGHPFPHCDKCGYCSCDSLTDGICDICGKRHDE